MSDVQNVWTTDFNALLVVVTHVKNDCLRQLKKKQVNTKTKGIGNNVGSFFCGVRRFVLCSIGGGNGFMVRSCLVCQTTVCKFVLVAILAIVVINIAVCTAVYFNFWQFMVQLT